MSHKTSVEDWMRLFKRLAKFLNLLDRGGNLSISNVAVIICITKMAIAPQVSIVDAGALLISLLNYGHKRAESNKVEKTNKEQELSTLKETLEKVVEVQNKITSDMSEIKANSHKLQDITEQAQKLVSNSNLAAAFQPFKRKGE